MDIIKKIDRFYFKLFPLCLITIGGSVGFAKLSMMQTKDLLGFAGLVLTFLFGLTALMYARARAVSEPSEMAKRAEAADECLKACVIASTGTCITAFAFFGLHQNYHEKLGHPLDPATPPDLIPMLVACGCMFFFFAPLFAKLSRVIELTSKDMGLLTKP